MMESPTTTVIRSFLDLVEDDVASAVLLAGDILFCCLECFGCSNFLPVLVFLRCFVTLFEFDFF